MLHSLTLTLGFFLLCMVGVLAIAPFEMVRSESEADPVWVREVASAMQPAIDTDAAGNAYVVMLSGNNQQLTTVKYNPDGNEEWRVDRPAAGYGCCSETNARIAVAEDGKSFTIGEPQSRRFDYRSEDYLVVARSPNGSLLWERTYDGPGMANDSARDVEVDSAGHVYVTGHSWGLGTLTDSATIKYAPDGSQMWVARSGDLDYQGGNDLALDGDGNVYVLTAGNFNAALLKYSMEGELIWSQATQTGSLIQVAGDGSIYAVGANRMEKYNSSGTRLWSGSFKDLSDDAKFRFTGAVDIAFDSSGNLVAVGKHCRDYNDIDCSARVAKFGADGSLLWERETAPGARETFGDVVVSETGQVVATGTSIGSPGSYWFLTHAYSSDGELLWADDFPLGSQDFESAQSSYVAAADGAFYVIGSTSSASVVTLKYGAGSMPGSTPDLFIDKTDSADPVFSGEQFTYGILVTNGGDVAAADVVVTDTLPAGVTPLSTQWITGFPPGFGACDVAGPLVTCSVGELAAGAGATVTIVVRAPVVTEAAALENTTRVSARGAPNIAEDTESTEVVPPPPVLISLGDSISTGCSVENNQNNPPGPNGSEDCPVPYGVVSYPQLLLDKMRETQPAALFCGLNKWGWHADQFVNRLETDGVLDGVCGDLATRALRAGSKAFIVISLGANDYEFGEWQHWLLHGGPTHLRVHEGELRSDLRSLFALLSVLPDRVVFATTYYNPYDNTPPGGRNRCPVLWNGAEMLLWGGKFEPARSRRKALNDVIREEAGSAGVHAVDLYDRSLLHGVMSSEPWVNGTECRAARLLGREASVAARLADPHPNAEGQRQIAEAVWSEVEPFFSP